jgi:hypothetical protein
MIDLSTIDFHDANRASEVLSKIGSGAADADFARAIHAAVARAQQTQKKARVVVTVEIAPDEERGSLLIRANVEAKLPKLPPPASQMHVGPAGELLTQQEFILGGGPSEARPKPIAGPGAAAASARLPVANPPAAAPVAPAPTLKPVVGKDAAAGKDQ